MKKSGPLLASLLACFCIVSTAQNCVNADFESSTATVITSSTQVSGAVITGGNHLNPSNSCSPTSCCTVNPTSSRIIDASAGYIDAIIGTTYPIYSVFGSVPGGTAAAAANPQLGASMSGTNVMRLNDANASGAHMERMVRTFTVTPTSNMLDIAFMTVLARSHDCCNAPTFKVTVDTISAPAILVSGAASNPCPCSNTGITFYATGSGTLAGPNTFIIFSKWQIRRVDLSAYVGNTVNVTFFTSHCSIAGHYGYAYIDTRCTSGQIQLNDVPVDISAGTTTLCSAGSATLGAPPFFDKYNWSGPGGFTDTNAVTTVTAAGLYTLSLSKCKPIIKVVNVVLGLPQVTVSTTSSVSCKGDKVNITASGLSTYSWSTGANTVSISVTPTANAVYTLSGIDANGCKATASFTQNVKLCPGISELSPSPEVHIYPNPSAGEFTIVMDGIESAEFHLVNAIGQVIHQQQVSKGENKVDVKNQSTGLYYYQVIKNGKKLRTGQVEIVRQ